MGIDRRALLAGILSMPLAWRAMIAPVKAAIPPALILQAASMVSSHMAAKGNPTTSLLNANFKMLEAINANVVALNDAMQHVIQELADIRSLLTNAPQKTASVLIHNQLFGTWSTIIQLRMGELKGLELNQPVDPVERFRDMKRTYIDFSTQRNAFLRIDQEVGFENVLHVCLCRELESELSGYLVERAIALEVRDFLVGDLIPVELEYQKYFKAAEDEANPISLPSLLKLARTNVDAIERALAKTKFNNKQVVGCKHVSNTIRGPRYSNWEWKFRPIFVPEEPQDTPYEIPYFQAGAENVGGVTIYKTTYRPSPTGIQSTVTGSIPDNCTIVPNNPKSGWDYSSKVLTHVDTKLKKRLLDQMSKEEAKKAAKWSRSKWNTEFLNGNLDALFAAVARQKGLEKSLEVVGKSYSASKCSVQIFEQDDASCIG